MYQEADPQIGRMQRAINAVEKPLAVAGSVAALAGGMLAAESAIAPSFAQAKIELLPPNGDPNRCPEVPTQPCDMGVNPAAFDNSEVNGCQDRAIGVERSLDPLLHAGLVASQDVRAKIGSRRVRIDSKVNSLDQWSGFRRYFSCGFVTKNTVDLRMVAERKGRRDPSVLVHKSLGKKKPINVSDDTGFDPSHYGDGVLETERTVFTLRDKLTLEDVKKQRVCIKNRVTSNPTIEKPYVDPYFEALSYPGPMVKRTKDTYNCITSKQVPNYKKYSKKHSRKK